MNSPFKFLDSYTKDDREIFFGREREIEELYHRVFESKIMLVYGVSGTGKSSLIHCGLANKFQETDWLPIVIRRGGNIIESMAAGIRSASLTEQQNECKSPADFKKGVRSLYLDHYKPVFFIFDQFEEIFIFGDREERRTFIHIVKLLTESDLQCRMIFVMREEYMAGVTEFEKFIPTFFSNRVRIEKMSHRNAVEAIKGPCKVFNISLEEGFAESLLEKLSPGGTDVELTYLQV
ncbi:MAG: ATP-binding protein, partial [Bacteroidales bacterium]|nr:ATP-binding protein [Bacteroidales bacterium]